MSIIIRVLGNVQSNTEEQEIQGRQLKTIKTIRIIILLKTVVTLRRFLAYLENLLMMIHSESHKIVML